MKVLQVHDQDFWTNLQADGPCQEVLPAGVPVYLSALVPGLQARGCKVSMVRFKAGEKYTANGYHELEPGGNRLNIATLRALEKIIAKEAPDIIHLHSVYFAMNPLLIRRIRKKWPVLYTLHDVTPLCFWHTKMRQNGAICTSPVGLSCLFSGCYRLGILTDYLKDVVKVLMNRIHLYEYRKLSLFIVPSNYLKSQLVLNGFDEARIKVLPHFARFKDAPAYTGTPVCQILFVGRLVKEKGVLEFAQSLGRLKGQKWEAVIVGDGPVVEEVRNILVEFNILNKVKFAGNLVGQDLVAYYRSCSFLVVPSLIPESFGLVGVEAMSFGKPAVAFASGGITEWLVDGVNGFLVPRGNVEMLSDRIDLLLASSELRSKLGENARRSVLERFDQDSYFSDLLECYDNLISKFRASDF